MNTKRTIVLGSQALLLFLAWSLACVSLAGGSSNTKSVKNASWFKYESDNQSVYCNLWGCCRKNRNTERCEAHDSTAAQHDKKSPILAMGAFAWLCTSAFLVVCVLNLVPTRLRDARGALLDKLGVGIGCFAWLWGVACWAQATTDDFRPSRIGSLEPIVWGPGFGATVTSWLFVMACTGLSAACLLVEPLKNTASGPARKISVVNHMRMPVVSELNNAPPLVTQVGGQQPRL